VKFLPPTNATAENDLSTSSKKATYTLNEDLFEKLNIDEARAQAYFKHQHLIKISIQCGSVEAFRDFDHHIKKLLEYIDGSSEDPAGYAPKN
jgi:hypothetical protein